MYVRTHIHATKIIKIKARRMYVEIKLSQNTYKRNGDL